VRDVETATMVLVIEVVELLVWTFTDVEVAVVDVVVRRVETLTIACVEVVVVLVVVEEIDSEVTVWLMTLVLVIRNLLLVNVYVLVTEVTEAAIEPVVVVDAV